MAMVIRSGPRATAATLLDGRAGRPIAHSLASRLGPLGDARHRRTTLTGSTPMAVSPDSINASVPSNTALATSLTSARVGDGAVIMLSIICVAVITGTPASTQCRTMRFCRCGTSSSGHSMPRSPRATITASERGDDLVEVFDRRQRLDLGHQPSGVRGDRARAPRRRSSAARTNDTARKSTPSAAIAAASTRSSAVGAWSRSRSDGRCTPGRPWAWPPLRTWHRAPRRRRRLDSEGDRAVAEHDPVAGVQVVEQRRVVDADQSMAELVSASVTSVTIDPAAQLDAAAGNGPARTFGPGRSASTATTDPVRSARLTHGAQPGDVLVERAVAEVEPHDVDAGLQHRVEHLGRVAGRAERGHDLRSSVHA